jgi:site-specific DNA-methyltransferase (adenine-specific)
VAFQAETWRQVLRVLKPGAHLLAFGGTRTSHRLAVAIEDAGFEIRDCVMWLYGVGFPKSLNIGGGWGTALKPAWEPVIVARKPLIGTVAENVLAHGTGALNIDGCRIEAQGRPHVVSDRRLDHNTYSPGLGGSQSVGTTDTGRWPANVIHDGSDEVLAAFPDAPGQIARARTDGGDMGNSVLGALRHISHNPEPRNDTGSAARFFYSAKATKADRADSKHPTVKPVALMRYLCRLVTPPGGRVLDPFAGSGTTGQAALEEGFAPTLIEAEAEYVADIERRLAKIAARMRPTQEPTEERQGMLL